jgi:hypothetical protein
MKRVILVLSMAFVFAAGPTNSQSTPPIFIGLGDSLGEGVQSADASTRTQSFTYLNLVAQQMGVTFPLPLIQSGALGIIGEVTNRSRVNPSLAGSNLAVSGADVHSLLNQVAGTPIQNETDLVLSPRTGSQMQIAESAQAPFNICWIGSNDVLGAVVSSWDHLDASQMTPLANFAADYAELVGRLGAWHGKVVVGTIPDVTQIGFLVSPQDLVTFLGSDFGLPQGSYTTLPAMLLIKLGINNGSLLQSPNFEQDAQEVLAVQQRTQLFNQIITTSAAQAGFAVADVAGAFTAFANHPPVVAGVTLTKRYLGGLFSLDGVHPSNIGHAFVANVFIRAANQSFGMQIPLISGTVLWQTALADPFVDWNGNLKVRGRPLAGLLETVGPSLGISGDFTDHPGAVATAPETLIDLSRAQAFMQAYRASKGLPPTAQWGTKDAIAAMHEIFRF